MGGIRSAIVLAMSPGADHVVGGLPLAARVVLSLHQAGFAPIAVMAPDRPAWLREPLDRRGVSVIWLAQAADVATAPDASARSAAEPVLVVAGDVLVDSEALVGVRGADPGPVRGAADAVIGVVCSRREAPGVIAGWPLGVFRGDAGVRVAAGLAVPLRAGGAIRALEDRLFEALAGRTAAGDSYLAALVDRRLSRPVTRLLLRTPIRPTHVTWVSVAAGLLGAAGLASVSYGTRLAALLLLVVSQVLDCVDGEIARARFEQSAAGARLDLAGDYLVHVAVFAGLATGLLRQGLPPGGRWAALALLGGVGAAMWTVHVLLVRPALQKGGDIHWPGDGESLRGTRFAVVAEKLASRDYTYLLLALGLLGRLEWFLYAAALGSWVFVAVLLGYRWLAAPARRREAVSR